MIGVLARRGADYWPCAVAAPSLFYVIWSMNRFDKKYSWEYLSFKKACQSKPSGKSEGDYIQPELGPKEDKPPAAAKSTDTTDHSLTSVVLYELGWSDITAPAPAKPEE